MKNNKYKEEQWDKLTYCCGCFRKVKRSDMVDVKLDSRVNRRLVCRACARKYQK